MFELEHHEQAFSGLEFLAWLLGFDTDEATGEDLNEVLGRESERAFMLAEGHYQRVSQRVAVMNPRMIAQIGFVQGATFAASALGRKPWPAGVGEIGHIEGDDGKRYALTVADYDALAEQLAGAVEGYNAAIDVERIARVLAERVSAVTVGRDDEPVDVGRFHRELAEAIVSDVRG